MAAIGETAQPASREGTVLTRAIDHVSRFTGLTVGNLYLIAAACTLWEVIARYVFDAPTQWAFEVVMVLCASAWMLSAGFVTQQKRHIAVTVFYLMANESKKWWLDLFAMTVGAFALYMLITDALVWSLKSIDSIERFGSAFNSPQPMVLKTVLALGLFIYLVQLMVNLRNHFRLPALQIATMVVLALMVARLAVLIAGHYGADSLFESVDDWISGTGGQMMDQLKINRREIGLGTISVAIVIALLALMMTGMPLGIVTLIISVVCAILFFGKGGMYLVSTNAFGLLENYALIAVPLFVLMASILERAGIARDLFDAMSIFAGNLRGGVALQTTIVAVILAAMSGVMGGEIVMLGLVALPQMLRLGYDKRLTIGLICAAGALATLIPPSVVMIIYGVSASVGIGALFTAGFMPGLLLASLYVIYVLVRCNLNPALAPTAAEIAAREGVAAHVMSGNRKMAVFLCIVLIACVMGSIYGGIASVTEAAAVGVFGAIIVAAVRFKFNYALLRDSLAGTMTVVGTIIWLIIGAVAFVGIYNLIGGGEFMRDLIKSAGFGGIATIFLMMSILVVLGTFMEWIAIIYITVPIFAPVVKDLTPQIADELGMPLCGPGIEAVCMNESWAAVWFGILFVMNIQIYFLSPPFGPACFWLKSVAPKDVTLQQIFRAVLPFIVLQIIGLLLVMFFPQIALWMPQALG